MTRNFAAIFAVVILSACGGAAESDVNDQRAVLPAAPDGGKRLMMPELAFEAGQERQACLYLTLDNEEPMWISSFIGHQGAAGHHLIAFTTIESEPSGTMIDCSSGERMAFWRLLFTQKARGEAFTLPEGFAIKVEPHARLVLQTHYVNTTSQKMLTRDALDLIAYPKDAPAPISIAPFSIGSADLELPPRAAVTKAFECRAEEDMQIMLGFGHMHEMGTSVKIELGRTAGMETIYSADPWSADYRDQPPFVEWPIESPLRVMKDDLLRVTCAWQSTSDETVTFPKEMCAGVLWFYPAPGPITCRATVVE